MDSDLYQKYRPKTFAELVGQEEIVATIKQLWVTKKIPQALFLDGPTGSGKTTSARILAEKFGCTGNDYIEINCAQDASIDLIRSIQSKVKTFALNGKATRLWYFDEVQSMNRTPGAQQAMLKLLEDSPDSARFILAAMNTDKILPAIIGRCMVLHFKPIAQTAIVSRLNQVIAAEGFKIPVAVTDRIADVAGGSMRQALQDLQKVAGLPTAEAMLSMLEEPSARKVAFDLAKLLVYDRKPTMKAAMDVLASADIGEIEGFRQLLLACANKELIKQGTGPQAERAWQLIQLCRDPFYSWEKAALASVCYEMLRGVK